MRSFPSAPYRVAPRRTARRRRAAALLGTTVVVTSGLSVLPATTPAAHADWRDKLRETQQKIETVRNGIDDASDALQQAQSTIDTATDRLQSARKRMWGIKQRLGSAVERDRELETELVASQTRLESARASLAAARVDVVETRERAADTITSIYQGAGDPGLRRVSSFLTAGSLEEIEREQQAESAMVDRQSTSYEEVQAAEKRLEEQRATVRAATAEVREKKTEAATTVRRMRFLERRTKMQRNEINRRVHHSRQAKRQAFQARRAERKALEKLRAQEAAVRKKILAAQRKAAAAGTGYTGSVGGLLSAPVTGSVTSPFGYREHPIYHYWGLHDGTDFASGCGAPLRAVADGTVISRYYSSVYGHRLYLSLGNVNGKNLTAVYNHASSYKYGVGARVSRGTVLGYEGSTGWSTGCHLHFTILANGKAVNPMDYL